jgi:hypothetical protein
VVCMNVRFIILDNFCNNVSKLEIDMSDLARFLMEMFLLCSVIATTWFGLVLYAVITGEL